MSLLLQLKRKRSSSYLLPKIYRKKRKEKQKNIWNCILQQFWGSIRPRLTNYIPKGINQILRFWQKIGIKLVQWIILNIQFFRCNKTRYCAFRVKVTDFLKKARYNFKKEIIYNFISYGRTLLNLRTKNSLK